MTKIRDEHLTRQAWVYVRQSTLGQLQHHHESRRLQYGLRQRAQALGWRQVTVVDEDLGRSGSGTERPGFDRLLAAVCQGTVGAVLSVEASRLARNGRDWHTLLELCSLVDTLIVDEEGIYDPRSSNDRLLLGLKGTMSEMELSTFRQRSQAAIRQMAARGALHTIVAVGYVRTDDNRLEQDPDRRVQAAIRGVFDKFRELASARQVLLWLRQEGIELPAVRGGNSGHRITWKAPVYNTVLNILTNPVYAGAYAWGRTRSRVVIDNQRRRVVRGEARKRSQWSVLLHDQHPGYISWDEFEANQAMIAANTNRHHEQGAPRCGPALLAGLMRCGHCGRKLHVSYCGTQGKVVRYSCRGAAINHGTGKCIGFGALRAERVVAAEALRVLSPLGVEAATRAAEADDAKRQAHREQLVLSLEQARYEAARIQRQYEHTEPEHRLVAAELERRWNEALEHVQAQEHRLAELDGEATTPSNTIDCDGLCALAGRIPALWDDPHSPPKLKKRLLRAVIEEIVAYLEPEQVRLVLRWAGGDHTELTVARNRTGHHRWKTDHETETLVRELARQLPDRRIAGVLNRLGLTTSTGKTWTQGRVCSVRNARGIACYADGERRARGELTLDEAAGRLGVSPSTVRRLVHRSHLTARQVCKGAPWVLLAEEIDAYVASAMTNERSTSSTADQLALEFQ